MNNEVQQAGEARDKALADWVSDPTDLNGKRFSEAERNYQLALDDASDYDDPCLNDESSDYNGRPTILEVLTELVFKTFDKVRMFGYQRLSGGRF